MKSYFYFFIFLIFISCNSEKKNIVQKLEKGSYKGILHIQDNEQIPFNFDVNNEKEFTVFNDTEAIKVTEISYKNDSIKIQLPYFEGYITAKIKKDGLEGIFIKKNVDRVVPFSAIKNKPRFETTAKPLVNIEGSWETVFSPNSEEDKYIAKGIFKQKGNKITGTFRTTTGDYRFLEGVMNNDIVKLSTFDGAHAFLFTAKATDSTLNGFFYSGNHWKESFVAKLNNEYELPDAEKLTFLKKGYDKVSFSFPDDKGNLVSLEDEKFKNKVTVLQIMGTWCPNCLDESKYYAEVYNKYESKGVEFVALAFEVAKTQEEAFELINRLKDQVKIPYTVLLAQVASASKISAQQKLPMLNHILSYPTTIIIDKKGKVRKIHTGFNGPATGKEYENFKTNFESFLDELVMEE
ncbi:peroxiredoxin family protein [Tenacibaculum sp. M341]|uniref:peroxiredoxin family protein n=1 Tax=Tenacibaculum sp. M341 TaxID=2530339 RepID=UPI0010454C6D|nr:TlpA disulfide reductase family protein [Tenacibaculum sp. M341]TCI94947.1 TlpA family protein disulfide reductase [Tenacibaculum sp. M341]